MYPSVVGPAMCTQRLQALSSVYQGKGLSAGKGFSLHKTLENCCQSEQIILNQMFMSHIFTHTLVTPQFRNSQSEGFMHQYFCAYLQFHQQHKESQGLHAEFRTDIADFITIHFYSFQGNSQLSAFTKWLSLEGRVSLRFKFCILLINLSF